MSSNLPPGVTDSMIPGNTPEDAAYELLAEELGGILEVYHGDEQEIKLAEFVQSKIAAAYQSGREDESTDRERAWTDGEPNYDELPPRVQRDLTEYYTDNGHDMPADPLERYELTKGLVENETPEDLLDKFLTWNGIINYTSVILSAVRGIERASR